MSYTRYYILLIACIGLQACSKTYAQEQYRLYKHIDNFDNSSCIRSLCIDKDKTLWIGTESGAYKLDGFKPVKINLGESDYTGRIVTITPDNNNNIYIQTRFLEEYIVSKNSFRADIKKKVNTVKNHILISDSFRHICNKDTNTIVSKILDTNKQGLITEYRYKNVSILFDYKRVLYIDPQKKNPITIVDNKYYSYKNYGAVLKNKIFIRREKSIDEYTDGVLSNSYELNSHNRILKFYPQQNSSHFYFSDVKGSLYKAYINNDSFSITKVYTNNDIINNYAVDILEVEDNIIIGNRVNGLYILKKDNYTQLTTTKQYSCNYLYLLHDSVSVLTSHKPYIYNQNKLIDSIITPVSLDNFFLSGFHTYDSSIRLIYHSNSNQTAYRCITIDIDDKSYKHYHLNKRNRDNSYFYSFSINGKQWISSANYLKGYYLNNKFYPVNENFRGLLAEIFCYVFPLNNKTLAICSNRGLLTYSIDSNTYTRVPLFKEKEVRYIYPLNDSLKMIFTYGSGIYLWINEKQFLKVPLDKNKLLTNCHYAFEDKHGRLWLPTNNGILVTNKDNFINYASASNQHESIPYYTIPATFGDKRIEFNGGSPTPFIKDKNDVYYLTNTLGVLTLKPNDIKCNLPTDTPHLYLLDNNNTPQYKIDNISFPKETKYLSLFLSNNSYWGYSENLIQEYCLCPESKNHKHIWLPVNKDKIIELLNIPNGCYTLCVRQLYNIGDKPYTYTKIPFSIELYWYQKTWVRLLLSLLSLSAILAYIIIKQRKLKTRNLVLSKEVARVTANLRVKNNELQHTLDNRDKLVAFISHDMAGSLHFLNKTMNQISNISDSDYRKQVLAELCIASEELESYTNDIIIWLQTQINNAELTVSYTSFNLHKLLQDISHPIFNSRNNNNTIKISNLCNVDITSDKQILGIIVHNILTNANKFTYNGEINIDAIKGIGKTKIIFSDTGKGFPQEVLKGEKHVSVEGHGLGLIIIKDLVSTLKGEVKFSNNNGAVVTIIIPTTRPV